MSIDELTPAEVSRVLHAQVSLDILIPKGNTLGAQYHFLGKHFGGHIRTSAVQRVEYLLEEELFESEVEIAKRVLEHLQKNERAGEYLEALIGWADGAELSRVASLYELDGVTLAMMMQNDDAGCQTVMVRVGDGVTLLHTEEDDGAPITERVTDHFLAEIDGSVTFIYNDLLPGGSAFGVDVAQGFAMACDVLRLHPRERGVCLSKIVGWMVWRMGNAATPSKVRELVREFAPYVDGYAMNVVYRDKAGVVRGYRATIGGNACAIDKLGSTVGSAIKQVNVIDPNVAARDGELRVLSLNELQINTDPEPSNREGGYYGGYLDRLTWINDLLREMKGYLTQQWSSIPALTLHSRIMEIFGIGAHEKGFDEQGKWNPSNHTVGATLSVFVGKDAASAGINLGPSLAVANGDTSLSAQHPTVLL